MKMKKIATFSTFLVMIGALFVAGCGDDEDTETTNSQPIIEHLIVPEQVKAGETVKLEAVARDADGDKLSYKWEVSEGTVDSVLDWAIDNFTDVESERVVRGGSWYDFGLELRVHSRSGKEPLKAYFDTGFRCAKSQ